MHPVAAASTAASGLPLGDSLIGNITVLVVFAGMIAAGIVRGMKEVREFRKADTTKPPTTPAGIDAAVSAITILENVTLSEWSRSNKEVRSSNERLAETLERVCSQLSHNRDEMQEYRHATADLRHAVDDLKEVIRARGEARDRARMADRRES